MLPWLGELIPRDASNLRLWRTRQSDATALPGPVSVLDTGIYLLDEEFESACVELVIRETAVDTADVPNQNDHFGAPEE
jgi:hypothetical protein